MSGQLLHFLGKSHADYLHARGKLATKKLLELLDAQAGETILEVGHGTGATLVEVAVQSKEAYFIGYDVSDIMHQKALERIRFCRLTAHIQLKLLKEKNTFPTADNTFDKVYAESIIGIQEGTDFTRLLQEIQRVLKPNGTLIFNETIWLETTDIKRAQDINKKCKNAFGIIQSNHDYPYPSNWKNVLTEMRFEYEIELPASAIDMTKKKKSVHLLRSVVFTYIGKVKALFSPSAWRNKKKFEQHMRQIMDTDEKLMEGIIVVARNMKSAH